jgi:alkanal monooxygenase alpha chain
MKWGMYHTTVCHPDTTERQVIEDTREYCVAAERLGFSDVWLLEHHFTKYGLCGNPLVLAGWILGHTKKLRVGTAVTVIPLQHPVRLAEDVAMLDQISDGRLLFGIGRGFFLKDFDVFQLDYGKNHQMMDHWYEIMHKAWTTHRTSADNEFVSFPEVEVFPTPYTKPQPPVYVACSSPSRMEWAAERGLPMMLDYLVEDEEKIANLQLYNEVASAHGHDPDSIHHITTTINFVGGEKEEAVVRKYVSWFEKEFLRASELFSTSRRQTENYAYYQRQKEALILRGDWGTDKRIDRLMRISPVGSVQRCIDNLQRTVSLTGLDHIVIGFEGLGERSLTLETMQRFMEEVAPHVKTKRATPVQVRPVMQPTMDAE